MKNPRIFIGFLFLLATLFGTAMSQSDVTAGEQKLQRFEIGGHFTLLRRSDADPAVELLKRNEVIGDVNAAKLSEVGFGARFTINLTRSVAIEAEANFFPEDKRSELGVPSRVFEPGGRKFQALFGPKIGRRWNRFGLYGKARPGFIRLERFNTVTTILSPQDLFIVVSERKKDVYFFNIDAGGVFEYYPSPRTIFRVDVGDTIIRYGGQRPKELNPTFTRHNLQTSIGFGFRF